MGTVNVNREVTDQFYRYKMPKIIAKVEGKGNGIKTVIVNMPEVAKALGRPPTYPTKYFGCELGAQTQFDAKNDRFIVNGSHDAGKLQDLLDGFIKRFVLCPECDNPETQLAVKAKQGTIGQRCIACGHGDMIDMRHKLTTFILKNPPDNEPSMTAATPQKKGGKKGKKGETNGDVSPEVGNGEKQLKRNTSQTVEADDEDDVDWGEDVSEAAVQARRLQELSGAVASIVVTDDLEKTPTERVNIFYNYVKAKKVEGKVTGIDNEKAIVGEAERLDIKDKCVVVLVELLLDTNILTQIKTYRNLFLRFTHENPKSQKSLLGGLEQLIGNEYKDTLLPKSAHIFKAVYDADLVEEEVLIEWGNKGPSKKHVKKEVSKEIHEKAEPFIKWLKEAEEEDDSSEEEEDVEVVYSHTEKVGIEKPKVEENGKDEDEDDDFDIDDI
jgi:translation initiation factor 5